MKFNDAIKLHNVRRMTLYYIPDIFEKLGGEINLPKELGIQSGQFTILDLEVAQFTKDAKPTEISLIECRIDDDKIRYETHGPFNLGDSEQLQVASTHLMAAKTESRLIVSHNVSSDKRYLVNTFSFMESHKKWFCTLRDISWELYGYNSKHLEFLLFKCRLYYVAHNSLYDAQAVLALLTAHPKELLALQSHLAMVTVSGLTKTQRSTLCSMGYDVRLNDGTARVSVEKGMLKAEIENLLIVGIGKSQIEII